jgi:CRP/FNR family transcriptional regulator
MSQTDRIALLRSIPYFAAASEGLAERVARECVERSFAAGERIFTEGENAGVASLHIVISGVVRIFKVSLEGREQVLRLMQQGDSFADVAAFDGGPYPANADPLEPSRLLLVPRSLLASALREEPDIALGALRIMAGRLRHMTALVEDLSLRRVTSRVAKHLLDDSVQVHLNQSQLAALLGTSREMISRSLHSLEDAGYIDLAGPRIRVLERERLAAVVDMSEQLP